MLTSLQRARLGQIKRRHMDVNTGMLARVIILAGITLVAIGTVLLLAARFPQLRLGRLPGDIVFRRDGFTFYFPLATCLLISLLLTAVLWLVNLIGKR